MSKLNKHGLAMVVGKIRRKVSSGLASLVRWPLRKAFGRRGWYRLVNVFALLVLMVSSTALLWPQSVHAGATSQGALSPSTQADNSGTGTVAWTTPGNMASQDSVFTTQSLGSQVVGHYAVATNYGFTIPTNATINGVVATIWRKGTQSSGKAVIEDNAIYLVKGGTIQTSTTNKAVVNPWATSSQGPTYGSSTDLWGNTLTPTDVNSSGFGVALSAKNVKTSGAGGTETASLDWIGVTVFYTTPSTYTQASYRWFGHGPDSVLPTVWGGSGQDVAQEVIVTSDGGFAVSGYTTSFGSGGNDAFLAKYNSTGALQWSRTWGGTDLDEAFSLTQTTDGGYAITGETYSYQASGAAGDMFVAKFSSSGTLSWSRVWGGGGTEEGYSIAQTSDGGVVVAGGNGSFPGTSFETFIVKYTSTGTLSWNATWGGSGTEQSNSVIQTSDGGYAVTGQTTSFGAGSDDIFLLKYNSSGTLTWNKVWGGTSNDDGNSVIQTSDGGYAITGRTGSFGAGSNDSVLLKYDSSGTLTWNKVWGGSGSEISNSVIQTSDGGYATTGFTTSFGVGSTDALLLKYDSSGTLNWSKAFGGANGDGSNSVAQTSDGGYLLAGSTNSFSVGTSGALIVKYDSSGSILNCVSDCTSPSGTITTPTATTSSPTATTSSPTASTLSPTASTSSPTVTSGSILTLGSPLAAANTSVGGTSIGQGTQFRLRLAMSIGTSQLDKDGQFFKLQYAQQGTDSSCDTSFTGETYADVETSGTPFTYYNDPNIADGSGIMTDMNDPTDGSNTIHPENMVLSGTNFSNSQMAIPSGDDGLWDIALNDVSAPGSTTYCFRVVKSSGSALDTYTVVPQLTTAPPLLSQNGYRWFDNSSTTAPTFASAIGGATGDEVGYGVVQTSDGGYAITGYTGSFGAGSFDIFLAKHDSTGSLSWFKTYSLSTSSEVGFALTQTSDGGYAVAGWYSGTGTENGFLMKTDSSGTVTWTQGIVSASSKVTQATGVVQTSDGGYIVSGWTMSYPTGNGNNTFLAKYTSSGTLSWMKTLNNTANGISPGPATMNVVQTSDGGYAVVGTASGAGGAGGLEAFLAKFDSSGNISWSRLLGGSGTEVAGSVAQTSDGGYIISGTTVSFGVGGNDGFVAKYTSSGTLSWTNTIGMSATDELNDVIQTSDGGYNAIGYVNTGSNIEMFQVQFDSSGNYSWGRTWTGGGVDEANNFVQTSDGGFAITGYTDSFGAGGKDAVLLKTDGGGNIFNCGTTCQPSNLNVASASPTSTTASLTLNSIAPTTESPSVTVGTSSPTVTTLTAIAYGIKPGTALAAANTRAASPAQGSPFHLRGLIGITRASLGQSAQNFKLQAAFASGPPGSAVCSNSLAYSDITSTSGAFRYYDNASLTDGAAVFALSGDPTDSTNPVLNQNYLESNTHFTNDQSVIPVNGDGEFDVSLWDVGAFANTTYCFRIVKGDGSLLDNYNFFPAITADPTPITDQQIRGGEWFDSSLTSGDPSQPFYW